VYNEVEIEIPRILPATDDGVFKTMLTHADAEPVRCGMIASFVKLHVTTATVRNSELPTSDTLEKQEVFDVVCAVDGDEQIDVEMQAFSMVGDNLDNGHKILRSRSVYNVSDLHSSQPSVGVAYSNLVRSFQITFCDFTVFNDDELIHRFSMRDENGVELTDKINVIFVELTKLVKVLKKPVSEMTSDEQWAVFLKYSGNPKYKDTLDQIIAAKEEIRMASTILNNISTNEDERAKFRSRRIFQMDLAHNQIVSFQMGKDEGKLEGKGERSIEIAQRLIKRGRPLSEIIEDTGLSHTDIERLRERA
jgi:predicted transposase/invertase (TIGR01784 family)